MLEELYDVPFEKFYAEEEAMELGMGTIYSMPGGLASNVEKFVGRDKMIRQLDGERRVYPYLKEYKERVSQGKELPFLVDVLNCCQGCNNGTAARNNDELHDDILFELQKKRNRKSNNIEEDPFGEYIPYEESMKRLNKRFEKLNIEDFHREYHAYQEEYKKAMDESDYQAVFSSMHKGTKEAQEINCHSCGYDSCSMMAEAIYNGYNFKENCVHYVKDESLRMYYTDRETQIPNLNALAKFLAEIMQKCRGQGYVAVSFNIKNFRWVNQMYGKPQGDVILVKYARKMQENVGPDEIVVRIGGDNFAAVIKASTLPKFKKLLKKATFDIEANTDSKEAVQYDVTAKAGVYVISGDERLPMQIFDKAFSTCTLARKSKGEDILYYDNEVESKNLREVSVEQMLRPALANNEFVVYYQPKVDMKRKKLIGAEALVRWQRDGKIIPPVEFIPICEETGFVTEIDFFVLNSVCEKIRSWLDEGLDVVRVSVNFSKKHFADSGVSTKIMNVLEKWDVPSRYLEVEFTETAYIDEFENLSKTMLELREHGLFTAIDDFGTGYSSLNLLKELQFDCLKLDKSFLGSHYTDDRNLAIVTHIIEMAKDLNMEVVSEGIEREEELEFMADLNCDIAQGYLFDKPLPEEAFVERLKEKKYE